MVPTILSGGGCRVLDAAAKDTGAPRPVADSSTNCWYRVHSKKDVCFSFPISFTDESLSSTHVNKRTLQPRGRLIGALELKLLYMDTAAPNSKGHCCNHCSHVNMDGPATSGCHHYHLACQGGSQIIHNIYLYIPPKSSRSVSWVIAVSTPLASLKTVHLHAGMCYT